ncbi:PhoH family protein [Carnobacterium sp.]|uniref:PhoH family protein n=1 Tax=Carnobacterium sp. TaxID=48221 RepID=UPI003C742E6C
MSNKSEETYNFELNETEDLHALFGVQDKNLKLIEDTMDVTISSRGNKIEVFSKESLGHTVENIVAKLQELINKGISISDPDIITATKMAKDGTLDYFLSMYDKEIGKNFEGSPIRAKNFGQRNYVKSITEHAVTFGIGPAGTGKTYLAVVMAINALKNGEVKKIILTRPAVEAGEHLGFLPGDLKEKVDPYLRPIYDALYNLFGLEHTNRLMERGVIEIAPLAYMRGRTLEDAFVILDEAQNTTVSQMKMFLTRLGFGSQMVINGDITQIDLPRGTTSGLIHAEKILFQVKNIHFVYFDSKDVVRHPVVASIIEAYDEKKKLD